MTSHPPNPKIDQQAAGRPRQSSTFRFIPSIEIIPAGRGPVPRTDSTPPQAKRWSLRCTVWASTVRSCSSFSAYEYDQSYALEVYNTYPDKFRVVTPVDATNPAIDDVVAKWAATPGARGIRIRMPHGLPMDADHPGLNRAFAAAAKHGLPVNLLCWGILDKGLPHIQRHRDTVIVTDQLDLLQPARPPVPADGCAGLHKL